MTRGSESYYGNSPVLSAHAACTGLEHSDLPRVLLHLQHVVRPEGLSPNPRLLPLPRESTGQNPGGVWVFLASEGDCTRPASGTCGAAWWISAFLRQRALPLRPHLALDLVSCAFLTRRRLSPRRRAWLCPTCPSTAKKGLISL